jgi:hypothetical protein
MDVRKTSDCKSPGSDQIRVIGLKRSQLTEGVEQKLYVLMEETQKLPTV